MVRVFPLVRVGARGYSNVLRAGGVVIELFYLLFNPVDVLRDVRVDAGKPRMSALDAPRDDAADVPARGIVRVLTE